MGKILERAQEPFDKKKDFSGMDVTYEPVVGTPTAGTVGPDSRCESLNGLKCRSGLCCGVTSKNG